MNTGEGLEGVHEYRCLLFQQMGGNGMEYNATKKGIMPYLSVYELPKIPLIPNGIHHPSIVDGRLLPNIS